MEQYLTLCRRAIETGVRKTNRTGCDHIGYQGDMARYNLADGFPVVTTRRTPYKSAIAEMLGFLRGYDSAADFRNLGCKFWDMNANDPGKPGHPNTWLSNPHRKGTDDVGRIYGVQARDWTGVKAITDEEGRVIEFATTKIDQLRMCVDDLMQHKDNRREIVSHWNPAEMDQMALPPCHLLYQWGIQGDVLNLGLYQRSVDLALGKPSNAIAYAWLLAVMAQITGLGCGTFTHFLWDIHLYADQVDLMRDVQLKREPRPLPKLIINPDIKSLEDLETWVTVDDFQLEGYDPHPAIKYPFSV